MNGRRSGRRPLVILLAVIAALAFVRVADATTFTVTNANDSGSGSLRAAIDLANADATATSGSPHSIAFSGTIGVIRLSSALPLITNHMTIDGGTLNAVIVDGLGAYRGFFIDTGTVTLRNLVIYNTKAKGGNGGGGGGGGAGLGGAVFVNQASAAVTLDTIAISTSNVTGGSAVDSSTLAGGGGGMAFNGGGSGSGGGGGGLLGVGGDTTTTGVGGTGGAGGGGGGGGRPYGGAAGSQVTTNAAPQRGLDRGEGVYANGEYPAVGGAGGFGGGGGGGVLILSSTPCCAIEYAGGGGAGGFGGGGGAAPTSSFGQGGGAGGAGGFGGGGGAGAPGGVGGVGGGRGDTNSSTSSLRGGGGAAFGPAAFVNLGSLTVVNSTALNLSATAGTGFESGTADATAIYNRAGTVTGSFASGTPRSGYWWYAVETGRGYAVEIVGGRVFMTFYFYADDGTAKWWTSTATMLDTAHYWASTYEFTGGQQLNGAYQAPSPATQSSNVFIAFTGPTTAIMSWADGTIPLTRFDIVGGGVAAGPAAGSPETGWYWNSGENGRGWFVEVQNSTLFLSGFMYDARGQPTWYTSQGAMTTTSLYSGTLNLSAGGKAIGGTNQAPTSSTSQGTVTVQFPTTTTAILTLPGGGTVALTRYSF